MVVVLLKNFYKRAILPIFCHKTQRFKADPVNEIIKLYVESYRFINLVDNMMKHLDQDKIHRYTGRITWYGDQLDSSLKSLGFDCFKQVGIDYDPGMPVLVQNLEDFEANEPLVIEKWIEPTIIESDGKVAHQGIVIVGRK